MIFSKLILFMFVMLFKSERLHSYENTEAIKVHNDIKNFKFIKQAIALCKNISNDEQLINESEMNRNQNKILPQLKSDKSNSLEKIHCCMNKDDIIECRHNGSRLFIFLNDNYITKDQLNEAIKSVYKFISTLIHNDTSDYHTANNQFQDSKITAKQKTMDTCNKRPHILNRFSKPKQSSVSLKNIITNPKFKKPFKQVNFVKCSFFQDKDTYNNNYNTVNDRKIIHYSNHPNLRLMCKFLHENETNEFEIPLNHHCDTLRSIKFENIPENCKSEFTDLPAYKVKNHKLRKRSCDLFTNNSNYYLKTRSTYLKNKKQPTKFKIKDSQKNESHCIEDNATIVKDYKSKESKFIKTKNKSNLHRISTIANTNKRKITQHKRKETKSNDRINSKLINKKKIESEYNQINSDFKLSTQSVFLFCNQRKNSLHENNSKYTDHQSDVSEHKKKIFKARADKKHTKPQSHKIRMVSASSKFKKRLKDQSVNKKTITKNKSSEMEYNTNKCKPSTLRSVCTNEMIDIYEEQSTKSSTKCKRKTDKSTSQDYEINETNVYKKLLYNWGKHRTKTRFSTGASISSMKIKVGKRTTIESSYLITTAFTMTPHIKKSYKKHHHQKDRTHFYSTNDYSNKKLLALTTANKDQHKPTDTIKRIHNSFNSSKEGFENAELYTLKVTKDKLKHKLKSSNENPTYNETADLITSKKRTTQIPADKTHKLSISEENDYELDLTKEESTVTTVSNVDYSNKSTPQNTLVKLENRKNILNDKTKTKDNSEIKNYKMNLSKEISTETAILNVHYNTNNSGKKHGKFEDRENIILNEKNETKNTSEGKNYEVDLSKEKSTEIFDFNVDYDKTSTLKNKNEILESRKNYDVDLRKKISTEIPALKVDYNNTNISKKKQEKLENRKNTSINDKNKKKNNSEDEMNDEREKYSKVNKLEVYETTSTFNSTDDEDYDEMDIRRKEKINVKIKKAQIKKNYNTFNSRNHPVFKIRKKRKKNKQSKFMKNIKDVTNNSDVITMQYIND